MKGLAATDLLKAVLEPNRDQNGSKGGSSYIAQKFSAGTATKKDEMEDKLVGLISEKDRELLALAEKNQYIALKGQSVETAETAVDQSGNKPQKVLQSTQEQLADVLNPKQQKELTTILQFKHSKDSSNANGGESQVSGLMTSAANKSLKK